MTWLGVTVLSVFLVEWSTARSSDVQVGYWSRNKQINHLYHDAFKFHKLDRRLKCAKKCLCTRYCTGFAYARDVHSCYLFVHREYDAMVNGNSFTGLRHYRKRIVNCPSDYTLSEDQEVCLKVYTTSTSHDQANYQCWRDSGHLYLMDTDYKKDTLQKHFTNSIYGDYFLGATQKVINGTAKFQWDNGREVLWSQSETFTANEGCIVTRPASFLLRASTCDVLAMFVCEIS
ncbi:uncharacterized protein [Haliotis asinina]|uniref:uncharacterized protein isoform X2 n=1 Tax=Haliotis asinina TaxID=109174 RepID=UPI003531FCBF